jgi:hypothetical protein
VRRLRLDRSVAMFTCRSCLGVRGNDLGNLEMAAFLTSSFPPHRLEIISSRYVEILETAISTFPPPTADQPALDMVGRPRP